MSDGGFPEDGFHARSKEPQKRIFVARANYGGGVHPCKLREGQNGAKISYGGKTVTASNYEVLVHSDGLIWKPISVGQSPVGAVVTGNDDSLHNFYTVRSDISGKSFIGKYDGKKAYFVVHGEEKEVLSGEMEILCDQNSLEDVS